MAPKYATGASPRLIHSRIFNLQNPIIIGSYLRVFRFSYSLKANPRTSQKFQSGLFAQSFSGDPP